jgi:hypothetical protein
MSSISSVGASTPAVIQQAQASTNKQPPKVAAPSQATQSAGNDPDHDGDTHGGGIDVSG